MVSPLGNTVNGSAFYVNNLDISKLSQEERNRYIEEIAKYNAMHGNGGCGGGCCYPSGYYTNNYAQNTVKKRVTILTDNYIKQLDDYLQNEDKSLREYAASEVVKRLSEDRTRYDNKQLNALVNRMLLDPYDHKVRYRGLMALQTQLAKGDENTKQIIQWMEEAPNTLDVDRAAIAKIKVQMSADTTMANVPVNNNNWGTIVS